MDVGSILHKARVNAGLTQEELGEKIGIERSFVSKLERNKSGLMFDIGVRWLQVTHAQDVLIALLAGVDIATVTSTLTTLIGGLILWI